MNPMKEEYTKLADMFSLGLDDCRDVEVRGSDVLVVYTALRLAANMPSEEEIHNLLAEYVSEENDLFGAAKAILARIEGGAK